MNPRFRLLLGACALLTGAAALSPAEPLVLPLREVSGLKAIRARFRGHVGWFVLATERLGTSVSNGFEATSP